MKHAREHVVEGVEDTERGRSMRGLRILVLASVAAISATGCTSTGKPAALSVEMTEPTAAHYQFNAPARVAGPLVKLTFKNSGTQPHGILLARVDAGHSQDEVAASVAAQDAPVPPWAHLQGGVDEVPPGQQASATVKLAPGSYFLLDPGSGDDDVSFVKGGAIRPINVTGGGSTGDVPSAGVTIAAKEYGFDVPKLKAGETTVRFENRGKEPHILVAAPIAEGASIDMVRAFFASEGPPPAGGPPPPLDFENSVALQALDAGQSEVTTVNFKPGRYAFVCFLNDRAGGPPHFAKGMLQEVKVS